MQRISIFGEEICRSRAEMLINFQVIFSRKRRRNGQLEVDGKLFIMFKFFCCFVLY